MPEHLKLFVAEKVAYCFIHKHVQCWIFICLVNHSVGQYVLGNTQPTTGPTPPSLYTHPLPPSVKQWPCNDTKHLCPHPPSDTRSKCVCALVLIKDYGHPLIPLIWYLWLLLLSTWETGVLFFTERKLALICEICDPDWARDAAFCSSSGLWSTLSVCCSSWGSVWTPLTSPFMKGWFQLHILKDSGSV